MKEYILKDKILEYLSTDGAESKRNSPQEISDEFDVDINYVRYCLDDLVDKNLIGIEKHNSTQFAATMHVTWITYRGRFFLNQSGGFNKSHKT